MYIIRGFGDTANIIIPANKYIIIEMRSKKYLFLRIGPGGDFKQNNINNKSSLVGVVILIYQNRNLYNVETIVAVVFIIYKKYWAADARVVVRRYNYCFLSHGMIVVVVIIFFL